MRSRPRSTSARRDRHSTPVVFTDTATPERSFDTGPVLVSVSTNDDVAAIHWAASEAAARHCALRVVHVFTPALTPDAFGYVPSGPAIPALQEAAQRVLDVAVERARDIAPELAVTGHLQAGETAVGILRQLDDDALVVLDRSAARRRWTSLVFGSLWHGLVRNTRVPVVLVGTLAPRGGPSAGRVVVALEAGGPSRAVLTFAYAAARRRHLGVTLLRVAGSADSPRAQAMHPVEATASREELHRLAHAVAATTPDLDAVVDLDDALSPRALADRAAGAALLVVGVSRRGIHWANPRTRALVGAAENVPLALVPLRNDH